MAIKIKPDWASPKITSRQIKLLETLSNAIAVSGNEDAVRNIILEHIKPLVDEYEVDPIGNILAVKYGDGKRLPKVMLAAHMDEVGLMITNEDGDGLYSFEIVGGIDPRHLPGKPVICGKDRIKGVIGAKPIHLTTTSERSSSISTSSLKIDVSPANKSKLKPGDWATFDTKFLRTGPSLRGKALDDRIGVAALITLLENAPGNIDLLAAFTVQEEIGLRGAKVAAHRMEPDMAIAIDCTPAMDMPTWDNSENTQYRTQLGQGPAIYIGDGATLSDPRLINHFKQIGEAYKIPFQFRQPGSGGTDAGAIHKQRAGIPSLSISVPGRYLHTAASLIRLEDWKNLVAILHAGLSHIDKSILKTPR